MHADRRSAVLTGSFFIIGAVLYWAAGVFNPTALARVATPTGLGQGS